MGDIQTGNKMKALERSSALYHEKNKKEAQLRENLQMVSVLQCQPAGLFKDDIKILKSQSEVIQED